VAGFGGSLDVFVRRIFLAGAFLGTWLIFDLKIRWIILNVLRFLIGNSSCSINARSVKWIVRRI